MKCIKSTWGKVTFLPLHLNVWSLEDHFPHPYYWDCFTLHSACPWPWMRWRWARAAGLFWDLVSKKWSKKTRNLNWSWGISSPTHWTCGVQALSMTSSRWHCARSITMLTIYLWDCTHVPCGTLGSQGMQLNQPSRRLRAVNMATLKGLSLPPSSHMVPRPQPCAGLSPDFSTKSVSFRRGQTRRSTSEDV